MAKKKQLIDLVRFSSRCHCLITNLKAHYRPATDVNILIKLKPKRTIYDLGAHPKYHFHGRDHH